MALSQEHLTRLQELHGKYSGPSPVSQAAKTPVPMHQAKEVGLFGSITDAIKEFGSGVAKSMRTRIDKSGEEAYRSSQGEISPERAALRMFGQGAGAVGDIGLDALKLVTPAGVEKVVGGIAESVAGTKPAQDMMQKYDELKQKYPEAMKDVEAVFNIASIIPAAKGAQIGVKGALKAGEKALDVASDVNKATSLRLGTVIDARRAASIAEREVNAREIVGRITQGKKGTQDSATRALADIDTTGVKTYADLNGAIENQTEALARQLDEYLDARPELLTKESLKQVTKVGDKTISINYVEDALKQLDELYGTIKDPTSQAKVQNTLEKLNKGGLNRKEINDVARVYGREFGSKAFNKIGDPLTSINAQAFENTRKGVKEAFRNTLDDDTAKVLDHRMSDLINTGIATKKMEEKVNALWQKVKVRTLPEKAARKVADIVDAATLHTASAFLSRMLPSNVGLKTMNALDIEAELAKNIKKLEKISSKDGDALTAILAYAKESMDDPALGLSIKAVKPETIAKKMDGADYVALQEYSKLLESKDYLTIDNPVWFTGNKTLETMGINTLSAPLSTQKELLHDILAEYEISQMKNVDVTR